MAQSNEEGRVFEPDANPVPNEDWKPGRVEHLILFTFSVLNLVLGLDTTILVSALPAIAKDLDGSTTDTFWAGTSFLLANAIFQPLLKNLSDDFGRRPLLMVSVVLFTAGTIVCCTAGSMNALIAGRAIQGVGGGGILSLGLVILTDIVPLRHLPTYLASRQAAWAVGLVLGPLVGGLFAQNTTWRWVFYVNLPFCAIGLVLVPFTVKLFAEVPSLKVRLMRFDWLGSALLMSSLSSFLIGITWGGTQFPWDSWHTLVPIIVGAAGLIAASLWEIYSATRPLICVSLFSLYSGAASYFMCFLQGVLVSAQLYYIPVYMQAVLGYSATVTGASLITITASLMPVSMVSGRIMSRTGHFRWAVWSGWCITTLGSGLLMLFNTGTRTHVWVLVFLVLGIGHGLILMSLTICTQALAPREASTDASVMYTFTRTVGQCIGVAIGITMFQNQLKSHLVSQGIEPEMAAEIAKTIEGAVQYVHDSPQRDLLGTAISQSFGDLAALMTALAGLGIIISLFIRSSSMDQAFQPTHVLEKRAAESSTE